MTIRESIAIRSSTASETGRISEILRDSFLTTMAPIVPDAANLAFNEQKEPERFAQACWQDFKVLTAGGEIKGMLFVVGDSIESLHLDPSEKRKGYGSLLLKEGESAISQAGYQTAKLDVLTRNLGAIDFYQINGWKIDHEFMGLEVGEVPVPMYRMYKSIVTR